MENTKLMSSYKLGCIELKNRIVMAPMTRSRAIGNIPNLLMEEYYRQRADTGLIITEGTSPSANASGYCHIPGLSSEAQVNGWKKITDAVHSKDGKIFVQLIHLGRISHHANLPEEAVIVMPPAVRPTGQMWADTYELKYFPVPTEIIIEEIKYTKQEYISAAAKAMEAGFDGIELHVDNDYMLEQLLSSANHKRNDKKGGDIENRCSFLLEVIKDIIKEVGKDKVGLCLSPYDVSHDMLNYHEIIDTYSYLAEKLNSMKILFIHLVYHASMSSPEMFLQIKQAIRNKFKRTLIFNGGYTLERAESELESGLADLIAFGRPFINNPDLVKRFANGWELSSELDMSTFYSSDERGYTDYPIYNSNN
jgi:N-ethylmaleimide reductase